MHFLPKRLHEVLLSRLVKLVVGRVWWETRRRRHGFMAMAMAMAHRDWLRVSASQCHHPFNAFDVGLVLLTLLLLPFSCFALGCLPWCPRLELAGDELEIIRDFNAALEEKEFEITCLVLELDLVPVLQRFADRTTRPEHGQDLTPMRSFDPVQAGHQCILLFGCPGSTLAW